MPRVVILNDASVARGGASGLALLQAKSLAARGIETVFLAADDLPNPELAAAGVAHRHVGAAPLMKAPRRVAATRGLYNRQVADTVARDLGIERIVIGAERKDEEILTLCESVGVEPSHTSMMGDDWPDLRAMRAIGYPIAVADADPSVRDVAAWTTSRAGGDGAVREAIEHLLGAKDLLESARQIW